MRSLIIILTASLSALALVPLLALAGLTASGTGCSPTTGSPPSNTEPSGLAPLPLANSEAQFASSPDATPSPAPDWNTEQIAIATTIVAVGREQNIPPAGWVVALATAMQESRLRNLPGGDADSIGVFQQRPSQGWGTPAQLTSPTYQASRFYDALVTIPGWQQLPLTVAAQDVQHSAFPTAYAQWTDDAVRLAILVDASTAQASTLNTLSATSSMTSPGSSPGETANCSPDASTVINRAATWLTAWDNGPVPYLSSTDPADWFEGYRRDCSGYASMALGLSGPGLTTAGLAAQSQPITKAELRAGDLLIHPADGTAGHVVIFDHWTDSTMTSYLGYEQAGDGGTHHRVIPYPYFGTYTMSPHRFDAQGR